MLIAERYFNVLVSVPLPPSLKGSEIDPLAAFETLNLELEKGTLPKEKDTKKPDKKTDSGMKSPETGDDYTISISLLVLMLATGLALELRKVRKQRYTGIL